MPRRPVWVTDVLIVWVFALILAVLSVVNIRTLRETYEQNERLRDVNRFTECFDPTTSCGTKVAEQQEAERKFLTRTMQNQAICTLLTSRTLRGTDNMGELERIYDQCVAARAEPPPPPPESPLDDEEG